MENRYQCQINLPGHGAQGQELLHKASVLIVGIGGLGCPAAQYLVASGVGRIGLADGDIVNTSNLNRQVLFGSGDVGLKKAEIAADRLKAQNPEIKVEIIADYVSQDNVAELISRYDLVLDCTDNFGTRYLLNDTCVQLGKPLVYGGIYQFEGQVAIWNVEKADGSRTANYRDLFPNAENDAIPDCHDGGVLPTLAGLTGILQAQEAIKYITRNGELLQDSVLLIDAFSMHVTRVKVGKRSATAQTESICDEYSIDLTHSVYLNEKEKYHLVDVRTPEEHEQYNIGGSNITLDRILSGEWIPNEMPLLLYCATGRRSKLATLSLRAAGFVEVYSLHNGINNI